MTGRSIRARKKLTGPLTTRLATCGMPQAHDSSTSRGALAERLTEAAQYCQSLINAHYRKMGSGVRHTSLASAPRARKSSVRGADWPDDSRFGTSSCARVPAQRPVTRGMRRQRFRIGCHSTLRRSLNCASQNGPFERGLERHESECASAHSLDLGRRI